MLYATGKEALSVVILCIHYLKTVANPCPASIPTLVEVPRCPRYKSEWDQAASRKQCGEMAAIQKCTDPKNFVYHCLLNEWTNGTVEVCSPTSIIHGYCAMYSVEEERVKENTALGCANFTYPCQLTYLSSDAYMYQSCYEEIAEIPKNIPRKMSIIGLISTNPVFILSIVIIVIVAGFIGIAIYIICRKICKVCRRNRGKRSVEEPESAGKLMMETSDGLKPAPGYGDNGNIH